MPGFKSHLHHLSARCPELRNSASLSLSLLVPKMEYSGHSIFGLPKFYLLFLLEPVSIIATKLMPALILKNHRNSVAY